MNGVRRFLKHASISVILALMVLVTSSCGNKSAPISSQTEPSGVETLSPNQPLPILPSPSGYNSGSPAISEEIGPVTITFTDSEFMASKWQPIIDAFNTSQTNVTVQFIPLVKEMVEGVQPDDIAERVTKSDTTIVWAVTDNKAGYLRDLQPLIDMDSNFDPSDFWPAANQGCMDSLGRKLGLPTALVPNLVYYDKQALELAGIPTPQPGWTWTDFKNTLSQLSQHFAGQRLAFADGPFNSLIESFVTENLVWNAGQLDATQLENDIRWYVDLVHQGIIYPFAPEDLSDSTNKAYLAWQVPFQSSTPPVLWFGSIQATYPEFSIDPAAVTADTDPLTHLALDRYGVLPLPVGDIGENQNTNKSNSVQCAVISAGSRNIQASWKWINYLTSLWHGKNDPLLPRRLSAPVRTSIADSQGYWNALPPSAIAPVKFALEHGFDAGFAYYPQTQLIYKELQAVFNGQNTLTNALAQAQTKIRELPARVVETIPPFAIDSGQAQEGEITGVTTISFFANTSNPEELAAIHSAVEDFNLNASGRIKVNLATVFPEDGDGYFGKLSGSYDCFLAQTDPLPALISGRVLAINTYFDADETLRHDLSPELIASSMMDGQLMSLPLVTRPPVLVYNADLLTEKGVPIPGINWTSEDLAAFLAQLSSLSSDHTIFATTLAGEVGSLDLVELLFIGRGHSWLDTSSALPQASFNTPELLSDLTWFSELLKSDLIYVPSDSGENWWAELENAVHTGKVAGWGATAGTETSQLFRAGSKPPYRIGILPLPHLPSGTGLSNPMISRGFYISSSSLSPEACWELGKHLSSIPNLIQGVPARSSIIRSPEWENKVSSTTATVYRTAMENYKQRDLNGINPSLVASLDIWWKQVLYGVIQGRQPEQLLQTAQNLADTYQACLSTANLNSRDAAQFQGQIDACVKQADQNWQ